MPQQGHLDRQDAPICHGNFLHWNLPFGLALLMACGFTVVAWLSVQHVNTLWDEQTDHEATSALLEHPLWGSGIDGSQARLPMYITAGAYAMFGQSIDVARAVAIVMGAAAIVLTFVAGRRWFDDATGLLAAGLLAVSPYFIGFARTALTEGDAFCPLAVLLTLLAFDAYHRRRDSKRLVIFAVVFGLALATKFYSIFLVPPLMICDLIRWRMEVAKESTKESAVESAEQPGINRHVVSHHSGWLSFSPDHRPLVIWVISAGAIVFCTLVVTQCRLVPVAIVGWLVAVVVLLIGIYKYVLSRPGSHSGEPAAIPWLPIPAWIVMLPLAAIICLAAFPEHVIQPEVARAFLRRLIHADHVEPMTRFVDPARLYLGIILFKLGLPFGILMLASWVYAWLRSPREPILRLLLAVVVLDMLLLTTLPLRQCFYLMSIYPLLVLMLALLLVRVARALRGRAGFQAAWIALVTTACFVLLWGDVRAYPDFNLFGYETVGNRWLGAETRGYRNLIQVTNDGTEDALRWCDDHVPAGQRVVSYLWDDHVIDAFVDRRQPTYELVRRRADVDSANGPVIDDADYLLLSLNNESSYHDRPSPKQLDESFKLSPAHIVWRGRGRYRLPVVQILQRRTRSM